MKKKIPLNKHRLSVFVSNKYIYAQIILNGRTLASASSMKMQSSANIETAKRVGEMIAKDALSKSITDVVFDRGKMRYHGRIKALADVAREYGLIF